MLMSWYLSGYHTGYFKVCVLILFILVDLRFRHLNIVIFYSDDISSVASDGSVVAYIVSSRNLVKFTEAKNCR